MMHIGIASRTMGRALRIAGLAACVAVVSVAGAQQTYPTPAAAADALVDGVARHDDDAVKVVLGDDYRSYVPVGTVDDGDVTAFLESWAKSHRIVAAGADRAWLEVGTAGWTLPIPLARVTGGWQFDTRAGGEEIVTRRMGRNELAAIEVALAYADAQEEYAAKDRDGDGVKQYAARLISSPGRRDGLYWPVPAGEEPSPLGPLPAQAKQGSAFHGYVYRILTAQGKDAPGGAKSYLKGKRMTGGYGLVAWPAKYGETGVMTFIVNQDGIVYQKNLGPASASAVKALTTYNPDASWAKAKQ
jgi:hypothetical protein